MKPDKHLFAAAGIAIAAACLTGLTWTGAAQVLEADRTETLDRVAAAVASQASGFAEQINRQILTIDQTLRFLAKLQEGDPAGFDAQAWRKRAVGLDGLSRDLLLTDEHGVIRKASVAEAIGQDASGQDYVKVLRGAGDELYVGPATIDGVMRQWHMNVARRLQHADGSFAGVIDTDYRVAAITEVFSQTDLGSGAYLGLIGLDDARTRGALGAGAADPDAPVGDTAMFAAIRDADSGLWNGPSASDAVRRIHGFRRLPDRRLVVVIGVNEDGALRPASVRRQQVMLLAAGVTGVLTGLAIWLIHGTARARRRDASLAQERAAHAESSAQLEVARALASAKADQLEATLGGMTDGISLVDAQLRLVEWNAPFPDIAGVPADILHVGLPMEDILRAQARTGQFGWIQDPEAEVQRRMERLRVAPHGVAQRPRPDGRIIELRRNRLPDGGFVTLYCDITERKLAEEALRKAHAASDAANAAKSRFVATVSHEIRAPLNALLNTVRLLGDSALAPAQQSLLGLARQSGEMLLELINDILDLSQIEAGKLSIRPSLFELRPLLDSCVEMFAGQAAQRGMRMQVAVDDHAPPALRTDPARLRQVQLNLLSNAMKYARPGEVSLIAEPGGAGEAVRLTVRDEGPVIGAEARSLLFRPFLRLERPEGEDAVGTGLGLSICRHLTELMGGRIGCDTWHSADGREGNAFWMTLPASALPAGSAGDGPAQEAAVDDLALGRFPPRTRILLTDDVEANLVVTASLLRRQGHQVDVAASGQAAIQAVQARPYDLLFMDMVMPGISGPDATRIIRALPEPARSVPVIALTGNVGSEDEAVCRKAGMDAVVGKPASIEALGRVLWDHVWRGLAPSRAHHMRQESGVQESPASGVLAMDRIAELQSNLPPAMVSELIEACLIDLDQRLPALRRSMLAADAVSVAEQTHAMVGMAAGYGMAALERRLRGVLNAARAGDTAGFGAPMMGDIEQELRLAAGGLRDALRTETV